MQCERHPHSHWHSYAFACKNKWSHQNAQGAKRRRGAGAGAGAGQAGHAYAATPQGRSRHFWHKCSTGLSKKVPSQTVSASLEADKTHKMKAIAKLRKFPRGATLSSGQRVKRVQGLKVGQCIITGIADVACLHCLERGSLSASVCDTWDSRERHILRQVTTVTHCCCCGC